MGEREFDKDHALRLLARTRNGGWTDISPEGLAVSARTVVDPAPPFSQNDNKDAANGQTDKGRSKKPLKKSGSVPSDQP